MNQGATIDTSHPLFNCIPLHVVTKDSTLKVEEKFIDINVVNKYGNTLLHYAAQNSKLEVVK